MNIVRKNVVANFGGQAATALFGIAFLPLYLRLLGPEAYGLIGFYVGLQAFFVVLDLGLSSTLNRELARLSGRISSAAQQRDLVRTLEWIYWPIGAIIAVLVASFSNLISTRWLNLVSYSPDDIRVAITLMGLATALQWPASLYSGGLRGLEQQVRVNVIVGSLAALRAFGSAAVLLWISSTLEAFLLWQIVGAALYTLITRSALWRSLPPDVNPPAFRWPLLREIHAFTLGMTGISALSFILSQSDRLILSKAVGLDAVGYYAVAATVASALSALAAPFFNAFYPRFTSLAEKGDPSNLIALYHKGAQLVSILVFPASAVIVLFASDLLLAWTGNKDLALSTGATLSVLAVGTAFNAIMHIPYALQLAHGWTRLALYQNIVAVGIIVPLVWILAHRYGGLGAAIGWATLNIGYVLITVPVMHRRLLRGEARSWYTGDVLPPMAASLIFAGGAKWFIANSGIIPGIPNLIAVGVFTLIPTALSTHYFRRVLGHASIFAKWR